ncbi:uncharacterized protein [Miscanthus floridulus]|uniref:uncharacterized protein n=1 Tax=Miscanthus floridulus TaxID=154761 RepID=UPI00345B055B
MKIVIVLVLLFSILVSSTVEKFDFFYLIQQVMTVHLVCGRAATSRTRASRRRAVGLWPEVWGSRTWSSTSAQGPKAKHDLAAILTGVGILPSDTETYPLSSVRDAIVQGTV